MIYINRVNLKYQKWINFSRRGFTLLLFCFYLLGGSFPILPLLGILKAEAAVPLSINLYATAPDGTSTTKYYDNSNGYLENNTVWTVDSKYNKVSHSINYDKSKYNLSYRSLSGYHSIYNDSNLNYGDNILLLTLYNFTTGVSTYIDVWVYREIPPGMDIEYPKISITELSPSPTSKTIDVRFSDDQQVAQAKWMKGYQSKNTVISAGTDVIGNKLELLVQASDYYSFWVMDGSGKEYYTYYYVLLNPITGLDYLEIYAYDNDDNLNEFAYYDWGAYSDIPIVPIRKTIYVPNDATYAEIYFRPDPYHSVKLNGNDYNYSNIPLALNVGDNYFSLSLITSPKYTYESFTYNYNIKRLSDDSLPPSISTSLSTLNITNQDVTVNVSATDNIGVIQTKWAVGTQDVSYFSNAGTEFTNSFNVSINGTYTVYAQDANGNGTVATVSVTNIDKIAPISPLIAPDISKPTNSDVKVIISYSSDAIVKEYRLNGGNWIAYNDPIVFKSNGTVEARGKDLAGNISTVSALTISNIDKTAPSTPTFSLDNTNWTNGNVVVTPGFSNDSTQKQIRLNGGNWISYTTPIIMTENGTVEACGTDLAGNTSPVGKITITNIDKIAPNAPVLSADKTVPTNSNVLVVVSFSSDSIKKETRINGGVWSIYTSPITLTENGIVEARGTDIAGNVSLINKITILNIDKIAPQAPILTADNTKITNGNVNVVAAYSTDSFVKEVRLNGGTWEDYTLPIIMSSNGLIEARGIDLVGNISGVATYSVTNIDKQAPAAPIISTSSTGHSEQPITVEITFGIDAGSGVKVNEYKLGINGSWATYWGPFEISTIGQTIVYARSIDNAGNISNETSTVVQIVIPNNIPNAVLDTFEPNNTMDNATQLEGSKKSYLMTSGDVDYYRWTATKSGKVKVSFYAPAGKSYLAEIITSGNTSVTSLGNGGLNSSYITVTAGTTYYLKVSGSKDSDYGESLYTLVMGSIDPDMNEPENNSISAAPDIRSASNQTGYISTPTDLDYYKFSTGSSSGKIKLTLTMPPNANYHLGVYKPDGSHLTIPDLGIGLTEEVILPIQAGETYYLAVHNSGNSPVSESPYMLSLSGVMINSGEPNDTPEQAIRVNPGTTYNSNKLEISGDKDYYTFIAAMNGKMTVKLDGPRDKNYNLYVLRGEGNRLKPDYLKVANGQEIVPFDVQKDQVYYLLVTGETTNDYNNLENYILTLDTITADDESNDSMPEAKQLTFGIPVISYISVSDDEDYYVTQRTTKGLIQVQLDVSRITPSKDYDIQIYSEDGKRLVRNNKGSGMNEECLFTAEANKKYYIKVYGYKTYGNYGAEPYVLLVVQQ